MRRFFRLGISKDHVERAVDDELKFHIETRVQRLIVQGLDPDAARAEALRQFGDINSVREDCVTMDTERERAMNRADLLDQVSQDLRYAFRALRKARGMSTVAVVTLAVSIALLTSVFSVLNAGFFRPLPYPDADRLVGVNGLLRGHGWSWNWVPLEVANALRHDAKSFERVAVYDGWHFFRLTDKLGSESFASTSVDTATLSLIGARAQRGRMFTDAEITSNASVALISDSLWRTRYGRDEAILGREIVLDKTPHTIIGVLQSGFRFNGFSDVWVPLVERADSVQARNAEWYWIAAKLKPGVSVGQARQEVEQFGRNFAKNKSADFKGFQLELQASLVNRGNMAYVTMASMFVLVAFCVFLIACSNVGNLLLVRGAERSPEMAIRASLGATKQRLFRQSLTESVLLALAAGVLGTALSVALLKVLLALFPTRGFPSWLRFGVDIRVLAFVLFITAVAVLAFGLVPARQGARVKLADALKAAGEMIVADKGVTRSSRRSVIVQIALSLSLFVASMFFARSYFFLARLDHGYDIDHVVYAQLRLDGPRYRDFSAQKATYDLVRGRLDADGRIEQTSLAGELRQIRLPAGSKVTRAPADSVATNSGVWLRGQDVASQQTMQPMGRRLAVSDEYFHLMRMSILRGRAFEPQDDVGGQLVTVVSQRLAMVLWGAENPLGKTLLVGPLGPSFLVVGVSSDVRDAMMGFQGTSAASQPNVYFSARQVEFWPAIYFRPRESMAIAQSAVETAMHEVDPDALPGAVWPLASNSQGNLMMTKVFGLAVGSMAICGTFLAMLGSYGVIAYGVTRRTREIGLRIALGARPEQVVALFTREAMRFTAIGLAIGVVLAAALSLITRRFVWGTSLLDPIPYVVAAVVFGAVSLGACWLAARRVSRVEPLEALRSL